MRNIGMLLLGLLLTCVVGNAWAESNCYLKLSKPVSGEYADTRHLIELYGGRIIHEFPATGEFICWMAEAQFNLVLKLLRTGVVTFCQAECVHDHG